MGYVEKVLQPGETIAYRAKLHWIIYLAGIGLVLLAAATALASLLIQGDTIRYGLWLAAAIVLLLGLYHITRAWIGSVNTEIIVTTRRIIHKSGFISRSTLEMNLDKVESVLVQQGLAGRMLDYGTVIVRGVGSGLEPVENIASPLTLHRHISEPV